MDIVINYWAVLGAAVANMVVGSLWYGPVFGKQWMAMAGFTKESMKSMPLSATQAMAGGFVASLVIAFVLAHFTAVWGAVGISGALMLGFWIWLGFVVTTQAHGFLWEGTSMKLFLFNAAASLVAYGVMTLVIVLWP